MRIYKLIILFLFLFGVSSCKKKQTDVVDLTINISLVNQQGQSLSLSDSAITEANTNIYYIVNGQAVPFYKSTADFPKGFYFVKDLNGIIKYATIFANSDPNEVFPTTIVKFGDYPADTIKCEISRKASSLTIAKFWLNNVLKYDDTKFQAKEVTLIK